MEKEGMGQLRSCNEKENDKDQTLKSVKVRTSISAASKFTPVPRKKSLVERTEPVIPPYDPKINYLAPRPRFLHYKPNPRIELLRQNKEKMTKKETFAEPPSDSNIPSGLPSTPSDSVTIDSGCLDVESNPQNSTSSFSGSPAIAPLDAHPSIPPYDPKVNYLSPRPRFLFYKPNPRIELLQNKEEVVDSEVKRVDDIFILESSSETFSDTDVVEESNSCVSYKDSEDSSAEETEAKEEVGGLSDKSDISTPISYETTAKNVEGKGSFFTTVKFASLLQIFLICVISNSVNISPLMNSSIIKSSSFSELHLPWGVSDMAEANFDAQTDRFKKLSFDSINHLSMLVKNLGRHDKLSAPQFLNLTVMQKDVLVGWQMHTSVFGEKFSHEVCENVIGGKGTEKFTGNFEKQKDGEPLPFEEDTETQLDRKIDLGTQELISTAAPVQMEEPETYFEAVSNDTHISKIESITGETKLGGKLDFGTQELTSAAAPVLQMEEPRTYVEAVSDDTHVSEIESITGETKLDGKLDLGSQELTATAAPVQKIEEPETYVEAVSDDTHVSEIESITGETKLDGKFELGTQELTSTTAPVQKIEEPETYVEAVSDSTHVSEINREIESGTQELTSTPTSWGQEEHASNRDEDVKCNRNVDNHADPATKFLEVIYEEKISETQRELLENTKLEGANDIDSRTKIEPSTVADINLESNPDTIAPLEMVKSPIGASEKMLSAYFVTGVTSIVLALISAAAYVYLDRGSTTTSSKADLEVHTVHQLSCRKVIPETSLEQIYQQRPSSQNWPREVDVMEDSCSSEMSSFQTRSSHSTLKSANEAQRQERKPRKHSKRESLARKPRKHSKRESLAFSSELSTGSPSYGSFTTYEKIPSKNASGDDGIMTSVRRSIRIRNRATSSQLLS